VAELVSHEALAGHLSTVQQRVEENRTKLVSDTGLFIHRTEFVKFQDYAQSQLGILTDVIERFYQGVFPFLAQVTSGTQHSLDETRGDGANQSQAYVALLSQRVSKDDSKKEDSKDVLQRACHQNGEGEAAELGAKVGSTTLALEEASLPGLTKDVPPYDNVASQTAARCPGASGTFDDKTVQDAEFSIKDINGSGTTHSLKSVRAGTLPCTDENPLRHSPPNNPHFPAKGKGKRNGGSSQRGE
jgi:hypothetical protein